MLLIKKRISRFVGKIKCHLNPVKYARSLGVKVGDGTVFYGAHSGMFGTEPWLISIGDHCHITKNVQFLTHDGGTLVTRDECGPFVICGDITVGNNVYIGIRTIILPGVKIGENSIIGCGSVVSKDIPANVVAAGVPCRVINTRESYIEKVKNVMAGKDSRYYSDLDVMHGKNPNKKSRHS